MIRLSFWLSFAWFSLGIPTEGQTFRQILWTHCTVTKLGGVGLSANCAG